MWRSILAVAVLATMTLAVRSALAADETHEGKVVAVSDGKIMLLDKRGDNHNTFVITAETKITRNGKPAKPSDVRPGDKANVRATSRDGVLVAKEIAAFAPA